MQNKWAVRVVVMWYWFHADYDEKWIRFKLWESFVLDETSGGGRKILKKARDLLNGRCLRGIQDAQSMTIEEKQWSWCDWSNGDDLNDQDGDDRGGGSGEAGLDWWQEGCNGWFQDAAATCSCWFWCITSLGIRCISLLDPTHCIQIKISCCPQVCFCCIGYVATTISSAKRFCRILIWRVFPAHCIQSRKVNEWKRASGMGFNSDALPPFSCHCVLR